MRTIQLYHDGSPVAHVLVSDVDYPHLSRHTWQLQGGRPVWKGIPMLDILAARLGIQHPKLRIRDPLDLRRGNLQGYRPHSTPGIKWNPHRGAWEVKMQLDGRRTLLGWASDLTKAEAMLREADANRAKPQSMPPRWDETTKSWVARVRINGKSVLIAPFTELADAHAAARKYLTDYKENQ
jgi:hypothetical protein